MQYAQQSLLSIYVNALESMPLTKGHVNFRNQHINASHALRGSKDGKSATLDLSEASDRVYAEHVFRMLKSVPNLRDATFACRSTRSTCPDGVTIHLNKFASMGSALCFPIESMMFYSIILTTWFQMARLRPSIRHLASAKSGVYVYGDDLIIPVDMVPCVIANLEAFGLKVSTAKSFWTGKFRESCGTDAYDGVDVTPVYVRRMLPTDARDVRSIVSSVSLANQLLRAGFTRAAWSVRNTLDLIVKIPDVSDNPSCVGYIGFNRPTIHRWNKTLHRPEVKGYVVVPRKLSDPIDGHAALMKWYTSSSREEDVDRYKRSGSSGSLAIKTRWCAV